jgi:hypothetical protein
MNIQSSDSRLKRQFFVKMIRPISLRVHPTEFQTFFAQPAALVAMVSPFLKQRHSAA